MINLVVAVSLNGVIGREGKLPWRLPSDLAHFKRLRATWPVIMGRSTWESLPEKFRPLPGSVNIVLSRSVNFRPPSKVLVCGSWTVARAMVAQTPKAFVIGGQAVYEITLSQAEMIHRTVVQVECLGDRFFPALPETEWVLIESSPPVKKKGDQYSMVFETWRRIKSAD